MDAKSAPSTQTVIGLSVFLICLVALLIFLYKKLNRETDGEYTIRQMVYKEGGLRDRVRRATLALETRLGVHLWPRGDMDEDGEEMQEIQDEEEQVEEGDSQGSDNEGDDQEEEEDEEEEDEDEEDEEDEAGNNALLSGKTKGKGDDTSEEKSNLEGSNAVEQTVLMDQSHAQEETDEKKEKKGEKEGSGEGKGEASGGTGLLIDLKQFSGSAIWSEENKDDGTDGDMTAL